MKKQRQKFKKVAIAANDWGVVTEYTADELTDNSNEPQTAEKAAERNAGLKQRKKLSSSMKASATSLMPCYTTTKLW